MGRVLFSLVRCSRIEDKIEYIAVHCSATKRSMNVTAEKINEWHKQRGWSEIGYHIFICKNGKIELGRDLDEHGAHVKGFNRDSWAVCLEGGLDENGDPSNNFDPEQMHSLELTLRFLKGLAPQAYIQGHRDFPDVKKDCPCFDVRAWLSEDLK